MLKDLNQLEKEQSRVLQETLDEFRQQPNAAELMQAYEALCAMNLLQAIQDEVAAIPPVEVTSNSVIC